MDGTYSLRDKREKYVRHLDPQPHAIPVFTVDTAEQGKSLRDEFCMLTYNGRLVWTPSVGGWERGNDETLDGVTRVLRDAYRTLKATGEAQ